MKLSPRALHRMLDANFNRAKEALRVTEDVLRFAANHKALALSLKRARHRLSGVLADLPVSYASLLKSRDTHGDVGKSAVIRDRSKMAGVESLLAANFKRAQESLRVLEEVLKASRQERLSQRIQRLRFEVYGLEKRAV